MSSEIAIKVENLSKCYQLYSRPGDRLKQFTLPRLRRALGLPEKRYFAEFWAMRDVSLEVGKGETLGVIGRNGSGKSTLLQMICGTVTPTSGRIETAGRIAALLELGSGFNPEFSGRDNVYMNAALLGLEQEEIDRRYGAIVEFADIGQFIDQPVKTYSSGMMVRLAFAVQAQVDPDILVVDEALAVGDAKFQARCFDRLRQLKENGASILLVTHSAEQIVGHCSRAVLLEAGAVLEYGEPRAVVNRYMDLLFGKPASADEGQDAAPEIGLCAAPADDAWPLNMSEDVFSGHPGYNPYEYRWGDGSVRILDFYLASGELYPSSVISGQKIVLGVSVRFERAVVRPVFGVTLKTKEGVTVYGTNSEMRECGGFGELGRAGGGARVLAEFDCRLAPGDYFISLGVASRSGEEIIPHDRRYDAVHLHVRPDKETFFGLVDLEMKLSAHAAGVDG
jgi:lipopolysaccharide transport system ATP-binding protein